MSESAPTVRLAVANDSDSPKQGTARRLAQATEPTVRLATTIDGGSGAMSPRAFERHLKNEQDKPALLVSYVYLKPFLANRHRYHYRDWVLDSGAFSAHNSGTEIRLQDYIDTCKRLRDQDTTLTEIFFLDVIGDWRASERNTVEMWKQGVEAIPCYHVGEPESVLKGLAKDYPKIALGGVAMARGNIKLRFAEQCFARVWPCRIHGFGYSTEEHVLAVPWHSVDATNWEIGPCKFGRWRSFGRMSVRGSQQNLRSEVEWFLKLEKRARQKWAREMESLGSPDLAVRLAEATRGGKGTSTSLTRAFGK